jgi:DNA-binding NarL/FixJ family response regulator
MLVVEHRSLLAEGVVSAVEAALESRARLVHVEDWPAAASPRAPAFALVGDVPGGRQRLVVRALADAGAFVIALGSGLDADSVGALLAAGAASHVSTSEGLDEVARAATEALDERPYLSPASTAALDRAGAARVHVSPREAEVMRLFVSEDGPSIKEIAARLSLSPQTVRSHLTRVRARYRAVGLDAGSRQALRHVLAREARRHD